jgi:Fe-S cluster assembly ATP-binding protein
MPNILEIKDLRAGVDGKEILKGISLTARQGEIHAIMGPNGSGKSTLGHAIMGHPKYEVYGGQVLLNGEDLLALPTNERAQRGLFLGFQYPMEVPGLKLGSFLNAAYKRLHEDELSLDMTQFFPYVEERMKFLDLNPDFATRYLNEGFSGGEKKRTEILQMLVLRPRFVVLDEADSGLDIDSIRVVANAINSYFSPDVGYLLITHYQRLLNFVKPHQVHVLVDGRIATSGGPDMAERLDEFGYTWLKDELKEVG